MEQKLREWNKRIDSIFTMAEAINHDRTVRKNLTQGTPNLFFVRKDLELTLMREDMLLKQLEELREEYEREKTEEGEVKLENKMMLARASLLRLKEEDLKLLTYIKSSLMPRLEIARELRRTEDERNRHSNE